MEEACIISKTIFRRINEIIGTRDLIIARREAKTLQDSIQNNIFLDPSKMTSGSVKEGFNMPGSDIDIMYWPADHHVISDVSQAQLYNSSHTIILMKYENVQPGFVFLQLLTPTNNIHIESACVNINDTLYISSEKYRLGTHSLIQAHPRTTIHGPCSSGRVGHIEYDNAHCLQIKHWPPPASPWIIRCQKQGWPTASVLNEILLNGCHCVAMGSRMSALEELEWRISFSAAEHKLVHSMNHTQFLCFGLLKVFLKEVVNCHKNDEEKLLCSYFMKTVMFWKIQGDPSMQWTSEYFLKCFRECIKLITKWVYFGYCPHFFIPQYNIFYPKIVGRRQDELFRQLYEIYNEGVYCLLKSRSISPVLARVLNDTKQFRGIPCESQMPEASMDNEINNLIIFRISLTPTLIHHKTLCVLLRLLKTHKSNVERLMIRQNVVFYLICYAFNIQKRKLSNNVAYEREVLGEKLMKHFSNRGYVSDILYMAIYYYIRGNYKQVIHVLKLAKVNLAKTYLMYSNKPGNSYTLEMCGRPSSTKMNKSWVSEVRIPCWVEFEELCLELFHSVKAGGRKLVVSPFVLLHFLFVLCYFHLRDRQNQLRSLGDLQSVVYCDDEEYVLSLHRDIALQMLGISQQLCGRPYDALYNYNESLKEPPFNLIRSATEMRIQIVKQQLNVI